MVYIKKVGIYSAFLFLVCVGIFCFSLVRASTAEYLKAIAGYRDTYNKAILQAETQYKSVVDAADKIESDSLKTISSQLSADQITEDEYYSKVSNIQNTHDQTVDRAESTLTANHKIAYQNYQGQRDYAWNKYVLGKSAVLPPSTPLTTSTPPVAPVIPPVSTSTPPNVGPTGTLNVFLTSDTYDGNLGGLSGAGQKCQAEAQAKNLTGNYKAILATTNDGYYYYPSSQKVTAAQEQAAGVQTLPFQLQKTRYSYMWGNTVTIPAGQTKVFKFDPSKWLDCGKQLDQIQISYFQNTYLPWCIANVETYRTSPCCKIVDGKLQPKTCCKDYKSLSPEEAAKKDMTYSESWKYCGAPGFTSMADRCSNDWIASEKKICEDQVTEITSQLQASLAKLNAITNPSEYLVAPFAGDRPEFYFGCNGYGGAGCYGQEAHPPVKITVGRETIPSEESSGFILAQVDERTFDSSSGFDVYPVGIWPGLGGTHEGKIYISVQNLDSANPRKMDFLFYCPGATNPSEAPAELNLTKNPPELFKPREYYKNVTFSFNSKNALTLANLTEEIAKLATYNWQTGQSAGFTWNGTMISLPEHTASGDMVINNAGYLGTSCNNWTSNDKFFGNIITEFKYMRGFGQDSCNKKHPLICVQQP